MLAPHNFPWKDQQTPKVTDGANQAIVHSSSKASLRNKLPKVKLSPQAREQSKWVATSIAMASVVQLKEIEN
jgi:hypothetical protein